MEVSFMERGHEESWAVDVLVGGKAQGHIARSPDGRRYLYFHGRTDDVYVMDDHEIEVLKDRISRSYLRVATRGPGTRLRWL